MVKYNLANLAINFEVHTLKYIYFLTSLLKKIIYKGVTPNIEYYSKTNQVISFHDYYSIYSNHIIQGSMY